MKLKFILLISDIRIILKIENILIFLVMYIFINGWLYETSVAIW